MKKLRLLFMITLLIGSLSFFDGPATAEECGSGPYIEIEGCPQADRPNGCKCCSDNHCASGFCDPSNDKCANRP
jgi:hypothetical protein